MVESKKDKLFVKFIEFPEILFQKLENDHVVFTPNFYLKKRGMREYMINSFFTQYAFIINDIKDVFNIDKVQTIDEKTGETWMAEELALFFIGFIEKDFLGYITESMTEMLVNGMVLSDSAISKIYNERFNNE